jgi:UDP-N-acetylmuramate--alanine ligase
MSDAARMIRRRPPAPPEAELPFVRPMRPLDAPADVPAVPTLLASVRSAYLVGIGGVGLGGAARLLEARGIGVRGSDCRPGPGVDPDDAPLPADVDLMVCSAAIPADHPQRREAASRGLRTVKYAEVVGALMADRVGISVAGSHGKTSTTALVASGLVAAGRDPSFLVGGRLIAFGTGARPGRGEHFVAEACEYDRSFHAHRPRVAIVTNVDEDHLDYYADLAEIQEAFRLFGALLPPGGTLVVNEAFAPLFTGDVRIRARIETYGFGDETAWRARDVRTSADGAATVFDLLRGGRSLGEVAVPLFGAHNVLNACAAAAALSACGLPFEAVRDGLASFGGVGRRLERVAERGGILLLDDYAHHPAEIRAVIRALRARHAGRRLVVLFQPHQASRTRCLLQEFAVALAGADEVWLPPIYFARDSEEERRRVTSEDLAARVRNEGGRAETVADLGAALEHAVARVRPGDVVVTMGAGNVDEVARGLAARL